MSKTAEEIAADLAKPSDEIIVICSDDMSESHFTRLRAALYKHTKRMMVLLPADATVRVLRLGTCTVDEAKPLALVALTEEQVRRIEEALRPTHECNRLHR